MVLKGIKIPSENRHAETQFAQLCTCLVLFSNLTKEKINLLSYHANLSSRHQALLCKQESRLQIISLLLKLIMFNQLQSASILKEKLSHSNFMKNRQTCYEHKYRGMNTHISNSDHKS